MAAYLLLVLERRCRRRGANRHRTRALAPVCARLARRVREGCDADGVHEYHRRPCVKPTDDLYNLLTSLPPLPPPVVVCVLHRDDLSCVAVLVRGDLDLDLPAAGAPARKRVTEPTSVHLDDVLVRE